MIIKSLENLIKRVLVYGLTIYDGQISYIDVLVEKLINEDFEVFFYENFLLQINVLNINKYNFPTINNSLELKKQNIELIISVGGDGTILSSAILVKDTAIPIVGINLGRLGFLAIVEKNKIISAIENIKHGKYFIKQRSLINLITDPDIFGDENIALNDFTIHKSSSPHVIVVQAFLNNKFLTTYWVDGLILSTPTGSTGYSLSCGGPIVFPGSDVFIITPVAPHTLSMRPIIIPDDSEIRLEIETRNQTVLCSLDSRYKTINPSIKLMLKKNKYYINLLVFKGFDFNNNLNNKLKWGADKRN